MQQVLNSLKIDTEKDLTLLDISSDFKKYFLSDNKVLKTKMYSLIVRDARTAGKVLAELEKVGISNVFLEKTEFSDSENLILKLKSLAVLKAKKKAESMVAPLNQKIGMPIFISDLNSISDQLQGKAAGIQKGSGKPNTVKAGKITEAQLREIATTKLPDLNAYTVEEAMKIVEGTARNMGIVVEK